MATSVLEKTGLILGVCSGGKASLNNTCVIFSGKKDFTKQKDEN